ncbi:MAG: alpha/beta hydrolase domain-containing protein [Chloroflexota bacterium]|nr:alpha/beta hydrolase domain-containing protein [Chloroflexota bacterium]
MGVVGLEIRARRPFADGAVFGEVGAYERIDGVVRFAVDPADAANQAIVDLDITERGPDGRVHFLADFCLLQPADPARGNRRLLSEVLNRGRKNIPRHFNRAPAAAVPTAEIDPGDGFLMRRGWTVAWCGWQWDVVRSPALLGLEAPQALEDGRPIQGRVSVEFQPNAPAPDKLLANRVHHPYPTVDLDDPDAELTVRDWPGGARTTIPRDRWRFARDDGGRPAPSDSHVWLAGGFEPGKVYEVVYRTGTCPVVGTGLLAVRDFTAFLRHGTADAGNPCAGRLDRAYGYGVSQSGRFLRHFLYLGLNLDEEGRQVFDGLIPQVAGARRGQFNHRFAQPSDQSTPSFGHLMPFADDPQIDPLTGESGGLLDRQRALGGVPKLIYLNTSAEYWRGDSSLGHADVAGTHDIEPPAEVRSYLFASTQHGPGVLPLQYVNPTEDSRGVHGFNAVDYTPLVRAALVNLDRWILEGVEPPPSVFPRLADGTAVRPADVLEPFRAIPGVTVPDPERLLMIWRTELGPDAARGIADPPARLGEQYRNYVSAVDADGNEVAGIRLPTVVVPIATYTGWNPRDPATGGTGQIVSMQGSTLPFPATRAERERRGDPRPSIEERYRDRDDYLARVRIAAVELARQGYILEEDVEVTVESAAERYDAFAAAPATARRD